ncbi:hypothetical protein QBC46DRAFT_414545 [Diplogelasinospora grovesii]|uniref:Uncharacterized protein n=1 Tax=Diplogelasinospora grovesii TaxID=303347 RepID=A0AAN6MUK8_9PEZI|nr:hypothetical protein QBC46DRAFT_414545 [Diplogelasinospora grovesii]
MASTLDMSIDTVDRALKDAINKNIRAWETNIPIPRNPIEYSITVVRKRPAFYLELAGMGDMCVRVINAHFPGLLPEMNTLLREFGEPHTALTDTRTADFCVHLFNLSGKLLNGEWLSDVEVNAGIRMMTLGLRSLVWTQDAIFKGDGSDTRPSQRMLEAMKSKRYVLLVRNENNRHWALLIHDQAYVDSLQLAGLECYYHLVVLDDN